jgi:hypothetical protein
MEEEVVVGEVTFPIVSYNARDCLSTFVAPPIQQQWKT